jgi:hypothetical protein
MVMQGAPPGALDGMPEMMPFAALALGTNLVMVAGEVPKLNIEPSCKTAGVEGMALGRTTQSCLNDENGARDQLVKDWSSFSASDKSHCRSMVSTGGSPSYVELLSCLEMSRDAKKIAQTRNAEQPAPTPTPKPRRRRH